MDEQGNTRNIRRSSAEFTRNEAEWEPCGDGKTVAFRMWARDEEHAIKIANERRAMLIATNQWTTDWDKWFAAQEQEEGK